MAPKKKPNAKNRWVKIRADAETKELFKQHAADEKMPVSIWAAYHLTQYIKSKPPLKHR